MTRPTALSSRQVSEQMGEGDWRVALQTLQSRFRTGGMAAGAEFVARVVRLADELNHHPDLTVSYGSVHVSMTTHDVGGLSEADVELARGISKIAAEMSFAAEPHAISQMEVAFDALDIPTVKRFWEAALGYRSTGEHESTDPYGLGPVLWFQQMDEPRPQRNRIHLDITVPHDVAEERLAAALAAGGTLLFDGRAPAFWTVADPEGNEVCICTWQNRE